MNRTLRSMLMEMKIKSGAADYVFLDDKGNQIKTVKSPETGPDFELEFSYDFLLWVGRNPSLNFLASPTELYYLLNSSSSIAE